MRALLASLTLPFALALPAAALPSGEDAAAGAEAQAAPEAEAEPEAEVETEADAEAGLEDVVDDLVRLPGQPAGRPDKRGGAMPERLVPGGVLIASFDTNGDGVISQDELREGIAAAFAEADANGDGQLTALEQQAWAANLPARDDTLANPVRFDPNLDRIVTYEEFYGVIIQLAATYQDSAGEVTLASLVAPDKPERPEREDRRFAQGGMERGEGPPGGPNR